MMMTPSVFVALVLISAGSTPLRVLKDVPTERARWQVDARSGERKLPRITTCTNAFADMKDKIGHEGLKEAERKGCDTQVVKDGAKVAEMKLSCPNESPMTIRIQRAATDAWTFEVREGDILRLSARYVHQGACTAGEPEVLMDADSSECQQLKAQLGMLKPEVCAMLQSSDKKECETKIAEARAQVETMCRGAKP